MKCLVKVNEHYTNTYTRSYFLAESRNGQRKRLFPTFGGFQATLYINGEGYQIENATGEIVARGTETDVFSIVEIARKRALSIDPLYIEIDTPTDKTAMGLDKFEELYGGIDSERTNRRKFKAYHLKGDVDEEGNREYTSIGIIEYDRTQTLRIASLYYSEGISNREAFQEAAKYIDDLLNEDDYAALTFTNFTSRKTFRDPYRGRISFDAVKDTKKMEEVKTLAEDAVRRQSSIEETLEGDNNAIR